MHRHLRLLVLAVCVAMMEFGATPATHARLGIAEMSIIELDSRTTITAVDADNRPVARLDLVHGRFMPTEDFGPEYRGLEVVGRRLFVEVKGQAIAWETIGFSDTRRMPPLSADLNLVAMFLADGRVRPILDKWRIGWAASPPPDVARTPVSQLPNGGSVLGTNPTDCSGLPFCPTRSGPTSVCGGFAPSPSAWVVSQDAATFGWEQDVVSTCCPANPIRPATYSVKTCSADPASPFTSSCGTSGGPCSACPAAVASPSCMLSPRETGLFNAAGVRIYQIHHCDAAPGTPPTITVGPAIEIWPPNRDMRAFALSDLATAVDACDNPIDVNAQGIITSIASNEPEADDFEITGASRFTVRADRNGFGNGRVYEIQFLVTDASGTSTQATGIVRVPHSPEESKLER